MKGSGKEDTKESQEAKEAKAEEKEEKDQKEGATNAEDRTSQETVKLEREGKALQKDLMEKMDGPVSRQDTGIVGTLVSRRDSGGSGGRAMARHRASKAKEREEVSDRWHMKPASWHSSNLPM